MPTTADGYRIGAVGAMGGSSSDGLVPGAGGGDGGPPPLARANGVEENVGADAIELSAGQLNRLNEVEPPVGDRYGDMTPVNR